VLGVSSENPSFPAKNIQGAPDARKWYPRWANTGDDFVDVSFATPVYATGVTVLQSNGGAVTALHVRNAVDKSWTEVWRVQNGALSPVDARMTMDIRTELGCTPLLPIDGVRIEVMPSRRNGWNSFDAIGLHGTPRMPANASAIWSTLPACAAMPAHTLLAHSSEAAGFEATHVLAGQDGQWCPKYTKVGWEYLQLRFAAMHLSGLTISQGNGAGAIRRLEVRGAGSDWIKVFDAATDNSTETAAALLVKEFKPRLQCLPAFKVDSLRIVLNTRGSSGWNCIAGAVMHGTPTKNSSSSSSSTSAALPVCDAVLWATQINAFSSAFNANWGIKNLLGAPDGRTYYARSHIGWHFEYPTDYVVVSFAVPQYVNDIIIVQPAGAGAVSGVLLLPEGKSDAVPLTAAEPNDWIQVYERLRSAGNDTVQHKERVFHVPLSCAPQFKLTQLQFRIDMTMALAHNGFDAVGVSGSFDAPHVSPKDAAYIECPRGPKACGAHCCQRDIKDVCHE
jgi:hypothetical protein